MRKEEALLAYLAVEHHHTHSRESLAGLFWPDVPVDAARLNLRVTLSRLKKRLNGVDVDDLFLSTKTEMRFVLDRCWLDVAEFTQALRNRESHDHPRDEVCEHCRPEVARSVQLYRGAFLDGLFLDSCQLFDEWLFMQREHLRTQVIGALTGLVHFHQRQGKTEDALIFARRQLEIDPLHEEAHRTMMQIYFAQGRRSEALRQYEICRTQLQAELGVEPSAQIMEIYHQILSVRANLPMALPPVEIAPPIHVNLPQFLTPFIDRQDELALLHERLDSSAYRLVTLMGEGGMGKTRLAVEAARQQSERFPDGVYFVSFAGVPNVDSVVDTLATALGVTFRGGARTAQQQLFDWLRPRRALLLLDNMEHLLGSALLLVELLKAAPQVKILVTSREPLGVQAEDQIALMGLEVPTLDNPDSADHYPSVRLFVDRAYRVNKRFRLHAENVADVVRICRLVEGRPLGLELAAVHTAMRSCAEIADAIAADLDFLAVHLPDLPARQRSLRAVFEQSWQTLTPAEQSVLARLSVFRSPLGPEAATVVAGASLPILTRLSNAHLIEFHEEQSDRRQRFRIHELLRQFAADKLAQMSPEPSTLARRHAEYFLTWLGQQDQILKGIQPRRYAVAIQEVLDDIDAAWGWASATGAVKLLARSLPVLTAFYILRGMHSTVERVFNATLAQIPAEEVSLRAQLLVRLGIVLERQGKAEAATSALTQGLTLAEATGDLEAFAMGSLGRARLYSVIGSVSGAVDQLKLALARLPNDDMLTLRTDLLILLATHQTNLGDPNAARVFEEAHRILARTGNRVQQQRLLVFQGLSMIDTNELEGRRLLEQALALCPDTGDRTLESRILNALGYALARVGRYHEALQHQRKGLSICTADQEVMQMSHALHNLCVDCYGMGDYEQAYRYGMEALRIAEVNNLLEGIAFAQLHLGHVLAEMCQLDEAAHALTVARDTMDRLDRQIQRAEANAGLGHVARLRGNLSTALAHAESALPHLLPTLASGMDEPSRVYLHCYQVLAACKDSRAQAVLEAAYRHLQSRAAYLDAADRECLFNAVPANREILAAWARSA